MTVILSRFLQKTFMTKVVSALSQSSLHIENFSDRICLEKIKQAAMDFFVARCLLPCATERS